MGNWSVKALLKALLKYLRTHKFKKMHHTLSLSHDLFYFPQNP